MQKPSPQFIQKLEGDLRKAYRQEFGKAPEPVLKPEKSNWFSSWKKLFLPAIPAFSAVVVIALVLVNMFFKTPLTSTSQPETVAINTTENAENETVAFEESKPEEEVINYVDSDELDQIDQGISLVLAN